MLLFQLGNTTTLERGAGIERKAITNEKHNSFPSHRQKRFETDQEEKNKNWNRTKTDERKQQRPRAAKRKRVIFRFWGVPVKNISRINF